jgi:hypothetical protein
MRLLAVVFLLAISCQAMTKEPGEVAKQEIDHLLKHLAGSGCQFNRNGTWYGSSQAVSHLKDKYDYLLKHDQVSTAEEFVAKAASESSASGKPYLVKCGGEKEVQSGEWFRAELAKFRSANGAAK